MKNSLGMKLVKLPGGTFLMGHPQYAGAQPIHEVTLSPFWIGQYEVTNAQIEKYKKRPRPVESPGDNQPVTRVTWEEADGFCKWLSRKEGRVYRLPTEAEWEYAARGGLVQKDYPWGNEDWKGRATFGVLETTPVGSHAPNGFGLYDMLGNVNEYVSDWLDDNYYARSPAKDPKGPARGVFRMNRGGSFTHWEGNVGKRDPWSVAPELVPDVSRFGEIERADGIGFRVVREVDEKTVPGKK